MINEVLLTSICRPKQWKTISTKDLLESGFPVYGANGKIGFYHTYTHEHSTVLITCRGATCGTINISEPKSYVNGNAMALDKLSSKVDMYYLKHYLEYRKLDDVISGSAQPQITGQGLSKVKIPLPPLPQQQKIANILDAADELRQNDKALVAKYDQLTQALFLDMFGDPVSNPKGWEMKEFLHFTRFDTKMTKDFEKYSEFPHVGIANIEKDSGKIINYSLVKDEGLTSGKYIFTNKHIIYSKIRPNLNKVALPDFTGLCSADSYPLLVNEQNANRIFFAQLLRSESFIEFILKHSTRTNIPKANKDQMKQYKGICPPISLQNQYAERVAVIEEQKAIAQKSLEKSEELFNSLLQKAFKGELA